MMFHNKKVATLAIFSVILSVASTTQESDREFSCVGRPCGEYADELDCKAFYVCGPNETQEHNHCPHGLLFNSNLRQCDVPAFTSCTRAFSCQDRKCGVYSDPLDCSSFYVCSKNGSFMTTEYKSCAHGLKFDAVSRHCDFPEYVNCSVEHPTSTSLPDYTTFVPEDSSTVISEYSTLVPSETEFNTNSNFPSTSYSERPTSSLEYTTALPNEFTTTDVFTENPVTTVNFSSETASENAPTNIPSTTTARIVNVILPRSTTNWSPVTLRTSPQCEKNGWLRIPGSCTKMVQCQRDGVTGQLRFRRYTCDYSKGTVFCPSVEGCTQPDECREELLGPECANL